MEKFRNVVENVESESLKTGYNPATGTNWTSLPVEMQAECLKHMDFLSRIHLKTTATVGKYLVESRKMPFDTVRMRYEYRFPELSEIWTLSEMGSFRRRGEFPEMMCLLDQILRIGHISCLYLILVDRGDNSKLDKVVSVLSRNKPLKCKILRLVCDRSFIRKELLSIVEAEQVWVEFDGKILPHHCLPLPETYTVSKLRREAVNAVFRKWIENDAKVGTLLRFENNFCVTHSISSFEKEVSSRVVWKSQKFIAIRMNNSTKRIVLSLYTINKHHIIARVFPASFQQSDELIMETLQSEFCQLKKIIGYVEK